MNDDSELLRRYAEEGDEDAFAALVQRHLNLVYSAARRQLNGDAHLAADAAQAVFTDLARKAKLLGGRELLAGWLYTSTRFAARNLARGEQRRRAREQEALRMENMNQDETPPADWQQLRPVLDDALDELGTVDREAILMRYFEGRDYAGVGARLNVSDNAARMRVERALDKLRARLERRGITSTSAALAAVLASQSVLAAPAGLAAAVSSAALAGAGTGAAVAATGAGAWMTFMSMTKVQVGITGALAVAGISGLVLQSQSNAERRAEVTGLQQAAGAAADLRAANLRLAREAQEVVEMRGDDRQLAQLGEEAAALQTRLAEVARMERVRAYAEALDLSRLDRTPQPRQQVRPEYPARLRSSGVGGTVVVEFIVDAKGEVQNARPLRSSLTGERVPAAAPAKAAVQLEPFTVAAPSGAGTPAVNPDDTTTIDGMTITEIKMQLELAAVDAVSQWKFAAGRKGGREVSTRMSLPIVFKLGPKEASPVKAPPNP